ncbi:putative peptidoglycan lipid II flippase [Pseudochelatococcus lubricantis]|uniref:Probable lipid II flippase MurJ n=1 Tax=Pseudochelatococcus lubricantis TaxID=1538102 RepID=A0ABX0V5E1_9HYPH|nr:lipid II flippase MurJ [Pseudochelatococcus lubricantis]NIJ59520.1 putative peptidoglycan lipid II flippase [Pseudochelatococcus lubricantis]
MSAGRSLARAGAAVGAASAASRVLGFARDVLIAQVLGAGAVADAFLIAFRIPNVVRRVLGEGGINAGFVPLYGAVLAEGGPAAARAFAGRAIGGAAVLLLALTALAELAAGPLVLLFAAGFAEEGDKLALAALYTRLALPFVAFTGLASLLAALLNAHRYFAAAAVAPALVNALLIGALLLAENGAAGDPRAGAWLAVAISLSGLLHLAIVAVAVARMPGQNALSLNCRFAPFFCSCIKFIRKTMPVSRCDAAGRPPLSPPVIADRAADGAVGRLLRFALPALVASAMTQVILLTATAIASAEPSAVSWLYYADRVFQLPLSFIGVAAGVVLLPEFVAGKGGPPDIAASVTGFLVGALALALPAAAGLAALGPTITAILFERGAFTAADGAQTSALLVTLALGLPAAAASKVLIQPFFARRQLAPPLLAGLAGVAVTLAAAQPMAGLTGALGFPAGLGLSTSIGLWTQALALAIAARRDVLWGRPLTLRAAGLALAAAVMGLAVAGLDRLAAPWLAEHGPTALRAGTLAALCLAGVAVYTALAALCGALDGLLPRKGKP